MPEVLIVDDDQSVREAFTRTLVHAGFTVTAVENGLAALQAVAKHNFDVVVCDYRMPELGGRGFYEQAEERFPAVASRVVFISAYADDPKIRSFLDQTGQPVLAKPVDIHVLVDAIKGVVARNAGRPASPGYGL